MSEAGTGAVDIFELAQRGARVEGAADPSRMTRLAGREDLARLAGPAAAGGHAAPRDGVDGVYFVLQAMVDAQGRPAATLRLHGAVTLRCDRCEQSLHWPIDEQRRYYFVRTERELAAIPVDDQEDEALLGSTHLDLDSLIEDEIILALPLSPRHAVCPPVQTIDGVVPSALRDAVGNADSQARTHRPFAALARMRGKRLS